MECGEVNINRKFSLSNCCFGLFRNVHSSFVDLIMLHALLNIGLKFMFGEWFYEFTGNLNAETGRTLVLIRSNCKFTGMCRQLNI